MAAWNTVWTAVGTFNTEGIKAGSTVVAAIPLVRIEAGTGTGSNRVILAETRLPGGRNFTTTVEPPDVPTKTHAYFPFQSFTSSGRREDVVLFATYTPEQNKSWITPGDKAEITVDGKPEPPDVKLEIKWVYSTKVRLEKGITYESVVIPRTLDGESHEGWQTPVSVQLQLPNGHIVEETVEPKNIPPGGFKEFLFTKFLSAIPQGLGEEILLTVTAEPTGGSTNTLLVGAVDFKKPHAAY